MRSYIPVKIDYSDIFDVLAFFSGDLDGRNGHEDLAKTIAEQGKEYAEKYWRYADMEACSFFLVAHSPTIADFLERRFLPTVVGVGESVFPGSFGNGLYRDGNLISLRWVGYNYIVIPRICYTATICSTLLVTLSLFQLSSLGMIIDTAVEAVSYRWRLALLDKEYPNRIHYIPTNHQPCSQRLRSKNATHLKSPQATNGAIYLS